MQQKKPGNTVFKDMQANIKEIMTSAPSAFPLDLSTLMETQRKNFQVLTEINRCAMDGWRALAQRQSEMASQYFQDNTGKAREALSENDPEAKMTRQRDMVKSTYSRTFANTRELAQMVTACTREASDLINQRILGTLKEVRMSSKFETEIVADDDTSSQV